MSRLQPRSQGFSSSPPPWSETRRENGKEERPWELVCHGFQYKVFSAICAPSLCQPLPETHSSTPREWKPKVCYLIDHFTVVCSVTWPLNGSEAGGDLVLIQTSLLLSCKSSFLYAKRESREVCIKARSPSASLAFIGQVT